MNDEQTRALIEEHYAVMSRSLPIVSRPAIADVLNPGTFRPENQGHPSLSVDQTQSSSIASASAVSSDGQYQRLDLHPGGQGVFVTTMPMMSARSFDGQFQRKNIHPSDQGVTTSVGTPPAKTISISGQNLHRAPLAVAVAGPPATNVDAGKSKPGGLPLPVIIT